MPDRWVNPEGWGPPPPPPPRPGWGPPPPTRPPGGRRGRRWAVLLPAAALVTMGAVAAALTTAPDPGDAAPGSTVPSTTIAVPATVATTTLPSTSTATPTTVATVRVPRLVGMDLAGAREALADRGLRVRVRYRSTGRYPAGTVISQSRRGAGVLPDSRVTLVVAKAPPPTTAPPPPTTEPRDCDPSYPGVCLDPDAVDYDCAGGSGDGPEYVQGPIRVRPPDPFDLDREGDGWGCERG
jgi:PASTA domain